MSAIKVFGHLVPDTDTTCSAIVYAWYLNTYKNTPATPYVNGVPNKEAAYILQRFNQPTPALLPTLTSEDSVVIVDTNNPDELPAEISEVTITEIIDHHKLGGIKTNSPLKVTIRPLACTATILWQQFQAERIEVPQDLAGMMLACILSDTLNFTSPTSTEEDKKAVAELVALTGLSADEVSNAMFEAKSDLSGMTTRQILMGDHKAYTMNGKKVLMAVVETTRPANVLALEADLIREIEAVKTEQGLAGIFFFIVDIISSSSVLLTASNFEHQVAEHGFGVTFSGNTISLPGVVSRKKQMVPSVEKGIAA